MSEIFNERTSAALARVIDDNLIEKSLSFPRFYGGEIHGPNPVWFITGPQMPNSNGVERAWFTAEALDEQIEAALSPFKARGLPLTWCVGPTTTPDTLGRALQKHGLVHNRDMIGLAAPLAAIHLPAAMPGAEPPAEFVVTRVADRETLLAWYRVTLQCFPTTFSQAYFDALAEVSLRPGADWWHYVGRLAGEVVCASSLQLGAGVAGFYNLGTLPELRGRGLGAWMTLRTYDFAREAGYQIGTLQTTYPNALRLYHRMGFEVYCKIGIYQKNQW